MRDDSPSLKKLFFVDYKIGKGEMQIKDGKRKTELHIISLYNIRKLFPIFQDGRWNNWGAGHYGEETCHQEGWQGEG